MSLRRVEADRGDRQPQYGPVGVADQPGDQASHRHRRAGGGQVPTPLVLAIGMTAPDYHPDRAERIGDRSGETGLHVRQTQLLDDLCSEHCDPDADPGLAKVDRRKREHAWIKE